MQNISLFFNIHRCTHDPLAVSFFRVLSPSACISSIAAVLHFFLENEEIQSHMNFRQTLILSDVNIKFPLHTLFEVATIPHSCQWFRMNLKFFAEHFVCAFSFQSFLNFDLFSSSTSIDFEFSDEINLALKFEKKQFQAAN